MFSSIHFWTENEFCKELWELHFILINCALYSWVISYSLGAVMYGGLEGTFLYNLTASSIHFWTENKFCKEKNVYNVSCVVFIRIFIALNVSLNLGSTKAMLVTAAHTEVTCVWTCSVETLWSSLTTLCRTQRTLRSIWLKAHGVSWKEWAHSAGPLSDRCSAMLPSRTATHLDWDLHLNLSAGTIESRVLIFRQ